jgi:hypothetical protein
MDTINNDQKAPSYMSVHFHALLTQRLGMRCYRSEEKYKFLVSDGRFIHVWPNLWGKWIICHNIREERKLANWEESDFCDRPHTSVERDFRLLGMGMMTSDLSEFCGFLKKYFDVHSNVLLHPEKRQLELFKL